jgi:nucleoside-diphosphate-sugar epimerase
MRVLVIGGTRFVGLELTYRLLAAGHEITLLNRATRESPFGVWVKHLVADRTTRAFDDALAGLTFDAAIDFAAYTGDDARSATRALGGRVGHYVQISSGQVYLVREGYKGLARETDYEGPLIPEPCASGYDLEEFRYGIGKRDAEDVLRAAWSIAKFPATALRIPMVNGPRDHYRRIEGYVARLLDGGPLLIPDGGAAIARHVYSASVVRAIAELLGQPHTFGRAYNLAQEETPTVRELVLAIGQTLGASAPLVPVPREALVAAGLDPVQVSPFSGTWMSYLDPALAKAELQFEHEPLQAYLSATIAGMLAVMTAERPAGYAKRSVELRLASRLSGA